MEIINVSYCEEAVEEGLLKGFWHALLVSNSRCRRGRFNKFIISKETDAHKCMNYTEINRYSSVHRLSIETDVNKTIYAVEEENESVVDHMRWWVGASWLDSR